MGWMRHACEQAAHWMSMQRDEPLSAWQGLRLKLHLKLCGNCTNVERQFAQIDGLSADPFSGAADEPIDVGGAQR